MESKRREKMSLLLPKLIDLFVATKQTEGRSPKTTAWYKNMLDRFVAYVGEIPLNELSLEQARAFVADLQGQTSRYVNHPISHEKPGGLSPYTISCYVRSLRVFSTWLKDEGFTKTDIFLRLRKPKLPENLIEILTDQEIASILKSINPNTEMGARNYLVMLLLLDTGIRASELITLTLDNTDIQNGTIKVRGKGNKERVVPFGSSTTKAIVKYVNGFRPETDRPELILNVGGEALTYNGLRLLLQRIGQKSGVERLHPHLLRHSFAVKYLVAGGDLMSLRLILGHTTISTTQLYLKLSESMIQVQHRKFSPVDRLNIGRRVVK